MTRNWRYARPAPPAGAPDLINATTPPSAALGPVPGASLRALADLGLSDEEIARYFGLKRAAVAQMRRHLSHPIPKGRPVHAVPGGRVWRAWRAARRWWQARF